MLGKVVAFSKPTLIRRKYRRKNRGVRDFSVGSIDVLAWVALSIAVTLILTWITGSKLGYPEKSGDSFISKLMN